MAVKMEREGERDFLILKWYTLAQLFWSVESQNPSMVLTCMRDPEKGKVTKH